MTDLQPNSRAVSAKNIKKLVLRSALLRGHIIVTSLFLTSLILQQTAIMGRQNSRASLKNIVAPTLVITGDEDMLIPLEHSQEIFAGIAGAKIVIIPMCGHMCTLEQPKLVNEALAEFIGS